MSVWTWSLCNGGLVTGPRPFSTGVTVYFSSEPCRGGFTSPPIFQFLTVWVDFVGAPPTHLLLLLSSPDPPFMQMRLGEGFCVNFSCACSCVWVWSWCRKVLCTGLRLDPVREGFGCVVGCALEPAQAAVCSRVREPECSHAEVWGSNSHCPFSYWDFSLRPRSGKGARRLRCLRHVTWQLSACCFLVTKIVCVRKIFQIGKKWINHRLSCSRSVPGNIRSDWCHPEHGPCG